MKTFGFQWHLTDRCNLRCAHCYQERFDGADELPLEELVRMADRIAAALPDRALSINLTGGEPLLVQGLFELIDHLHRLPQLQEVHLITNATLVPDRALEALRAFPRIGAIKVSIEAGDEAANDALRGSGNLARVSANLPRLLATGKQVVAMATLSRLNLPFIESTVAWARRQGLSGIIFERFVPLGNGRVMSDQVLSPSQWRQAIAAIGRAVGLEEDPLNLLPYHAFWVSFVTGEEPLRGALCNLGDEAMALMPDGTVFPCRRLPVRVGNLLQDPVECILQELRRYHADALRPRLRGTLCGVCGIADCIGCRALAHAITGDLLADDPLCPFQEE